MDMVFPGSFDPVTYGHTDVIDRASKLCGTLHIAVLNNTKKSYTFALEARLEMLKIACMARKNVIIEPFDGLLADYCRARGIGIVVRGVRNFLDYEYERSMALTNRALGGIETLLLPASPEVSYISSSNVREILAFAGDTSALLPPEVKQYIDALRHAAI